MAKSVSYRITSERAVAGGRRTALDFESGRERVPGLLLLPAVRARSGVPAALLLHGYASRKEHMADTLGQALLARSIASLAIDLPLHGDRGEPFDLLSVGNPMQLLQRWRTAREECATALSFLGQLPEVDASRLSLVGYSLGSFLGVIVAGSEPAVRAVVLAAGGDLPLGTPFSRLVRTIADPLRAVRGLKGRPLLMVHGKWDRTVTPDQAERLFAAAGEPKEIRWWDSAHRLPPAAIAEAADWLARRSGVLRSTGAGP